MYGYRAFGLAVSSNLECRDLPHDNGFPPDVHINFGPVPRHLETPQAIAGCFEASTDVHLFDLPGIGCYLVESGKAITVAPNPSTDPDTTQAFLLNAAFAALLDQRGMLVFRGDVVATDRGVALLIGPPATGKSTLAASLATHGFAIVADGLCPVIEEQAGTHVAIDGLPTMLLCPDAIARLGLPTAGLRPLRPNVPLFRVPVPSTEHRGARRIRGVCWLNPLMGVVETPVAIRGTRKLTLLSAATVTWSLLGGIDRSGAKFRQLAGVAAAVPIFEIAPRLYQRDVDEVANLMRREFGL